MIGNHGRQIHRAENGDAVVHHMVSPGRVSSQLPPRSAAISTITEPGAMALTISAVIRIGAFLAGNGGGGDHDILFAQHFGHAVRAAG